MVESGYQDVRDALDAIVRGNAIPEAYAVVERFGYRELFYGCIYREEIWMEVTTAREIIKRAQADDVYDGPMPEGDDEAITEAQGIVEMAEDAWSKHIRGPEVETILNLAKEGSKNGDEPEAEPEAETETDKGPTLQSGAAKLQKVEPWEGYADDTVKNITEGLNYFAEDEESSILEILRHVWQFETAHKNRARILTHTSEMYEKFGGVVETEEGEPTGSTEDEADTGAEAPDTEAVGESDGEGVGDGGAEGVSSDEQAEPTDSGDDDGDAEPVAEPEDRKSDGEGKAGEAKPSKEGDGDGSGKGPSAYAKLIQGVEDELRRERLDVPNPPEEKAPELPWNWGEIKNSELQELHMRYSVCAYYKSYRLALHNRIAQHCKEAADALHNEKMTKISKYDEKGKEKKVGLIEAEIAMDPHVKRWRVLQRKHEQLAAADKGEMDGYYKVVEALSRLETMRHNAWERARR